MRLQTASYPSIVNTTLCPQHVPRLLPIAINHTVILSDMKDQTRGRLLTR